MGPTDLLGSALGVGLALRVGHGELIEDDGVGHLCHSAGLIQGRRQPLRLPEGTAGSVRQATAGLASL